MPVQSTTDPTRFHLVPLLSGDECAQLCRRIDGLRPRWGRVNPTLPFFTLGTASYLHANPANDDYERRARDTNRLLTEHFSDVYERLRPVLAAHLGQPVRDCDRAALPGFHLFGFHPLFRLAIAGAHFDIMHRLVRWPEPIDQLEGVSFTLPLELPHGGGGIDYWDLTPDDLQGLDGPAIGELTDRYETRHLAHRLGTLVVHSGRVLHRIAPTPGIAPGDRRITLQGHTVAAGSWSYWYW